MIGNVGFLQELSVDIHLAVLSSTRSPAGRSRA
jgi:hypothetical protein